MVKSGKGLNYLKIFLLICAVFLLLWYLAPLVSGIFNIGNAVGVAFSVALLVFSIYLDKMPSWLKIAGFCVLGALIIVVTPLSVNMARYANYKTDSGAQTVVVLGCKVNGTQPSKYLYDRCAAAAEYLNENENAVAILSGGQGPDEGISEAQCMENVLVEMGISKDRLYKEDNSTNTQENLEFSLEIIENEGLSKDIVVVTNEFHEYRAKLICDKLGLNFHSKCSNSSFYTFLTFYTREMMGIVKELIM